MGYIKVTNIETGEVELEVGVKPVWEHDDEYVCPYSGIGMSPKPKQQYVERMKETKMDFAKIIGGLTLELAILSTIPAYITHVVWGVKLLIAGEMETLGDVFLAIAGMIVPPIGVIHGYVIWFS